MKSFILTLAFLMTAIPALATDVVLALKPDGVATGETCRAALSSAAEMSQAIWEKGNPEATKVEAYLPNVNTPISADPTRNLCWVTDRLSEDEVDGLLAVWAVSQPHVLVDQIIVMRPDEEGNLPDYPTWEVEVDVTDEAGNVTGTRTLTRTVGRIKR